MPSAAGGRPAVSVVIPTYQRAERLVRALTALAAQDVDVPFELVIVDDGSTDTTPDVVAAVADETTLPVRLLRHSANRGPSAARKAGWRAAVADIVAFTDDDCRASPDWLRAILDAMCAGADVVQGRTMPDPEHDHRLGPFSRTLDVSDEGLYPTCNVAYRRSMLEALGGFDARYRRSCDDTDLACRARQRGAVTVFAERAVVYHEITRSSAWRLMKTLPRWEDVALAVKTHPELRRRYFTAWLFWKRAHPHAIAALAGLVLTAAFRRPAMRRTGLLLLAPYVDLRLRRAPLPRTLFRQRTILLPAALAVDVAEVAVMAKGSVRHRTVAL